MKQIIKLTTISGEPLYLRDSYSIMAINHATQGDMRATEIHIPGVIFRVKDSVEDVAKKLGWDKSDES